MEDALRGLAIMAGIAVLIGGTETVRAAEGIACAYDATEPAIRDKIRSQVVGLLLNAAPPPAEARKLREAAEGCGGRNGWPVARQKASFNHALARLMVEAANIDAVEEGLDPAAVERAYLAIPESDRREKLGQQLDAAGEDLIVAAGEAQGLRLETERQRALFGMTMAALHTREEAERLFAAR